MRVIVQDRVYEALDQFYAFHVVALPSGELVVSVEDVRHDLLFHD